VLQYPLDRTNDRDVVTLYERDLSVLEPQEFINDRCCRPVFELIADVGLLLFTPLCWSRKNSSTTGVVDPLLSSLQMLVCFFSLLCAGAARIHQRQVLSTRY
jgi:hypothetical protein